MLLIRSLDLVVVGLPVLKRQSLGRGDPKLSLLCLWGQSSRFLQLRNYTWFKCLQRTTKFYLTLRD